MRITLLLAALIPFVAMAGGASASPLRTVGEGGLVLAVVAIVVREAFKARKVQKNGSSATIAALEARLEQQGQDEAKAIMGSLRDCAVQQTAILEGQATTGKQSLEVLEEIRDQLKVAVQ